MKFGSVIVVLWLLPAFCSAIVSMPEAKTRRCAFRVAEPQIVATDERIINRKFLHEITEIVTTVSSLFEIYGSLRDGDPPIPDARDLPKKLSQIIEFLEMTNHLAKEPTHNLCRRLNDMKLHAATKREYEALAIDLREAFRAIRMGIFEEWGVSGGYQ